MPSRGSLSISPPQSEADTIEDETHALRRRIEHMEPEESLHEAMIVMSRRFEAKPDSELPQLIERAKDELAELDIKDQEIYAGYVAIRERQKAELREERRQQHE